MTSDSILSQDAIDALLAGSGAGPDDSTPEAPSNVVADVTPVITTASASETTSNADSDSEVTLEQVITIAGQAAEAETAPVHDSISRIYQRIGYVEQMISRIAQLEAEVERLKQAS